MLHAAGIAIYNGDIVKEDRFNYSSRSEMVRVAPSLIQLAHELDVDAAVHQAKPKHPNEFATISDLVNHHDLVAEGQKVVAFGSKTVINDVTMYPYLGRTNGKAFIALLRNDYGTVSADFRILIIQRVTARDS
jgi:hypothetical protein